MKQSKVKLRKKIKILDYYITPVNIEEVLKFINYRIKNKLFGYICVSAVHGAVESIYNPKFRIAHKKAILSVADGRPIYFALKLFKQTNIEHLPGYHLTKMICDYASNKNLSLGVYGGNKNTQKKFVSKLKKKNTKLKFNYIYSPPFRNLSKEETKQVQKQINKSKVDILFVALGAPKQEIWMHDNYKKINCVSIGIGAAIDFISGNKKMAPKYMEFLGLAWLFRLISEPRRLFLRYLITNSLFLYLFTLQYIKLKFKK